MSLYKTFNSNFI